MSNWYKGNIHTHTTKSDGDADPEFVVKWFMEHGYDFLVLSDHNHRTILEHEVEGGPLMVPGEEVSARILEGSIPIHVNGIGITRVVEPYHGDEIVDTIQGNVNAILDAGGIASINHPNYQWAFDHTHVREVDGASLIEVYNGSPVTNNEGGPGKVTAEDIWDGVLTAGKPIFGVASDDSHNYFDFAHDKLNPGRGWVVVDADELSVDAIVSGMADGHFYSSTGVTLTDLESTEERISLTIEQYATCLYRTVFSGPDGRMFAECDGLEPEYDIEGDEGYVRATVYSSLGVKAWTQPVFVSEEK